MQFYEFFKSVLDYVPDSYGYARDFMWSIMPYILMGCALFTAFFGLKCANAWCYVTFFLMGGSLSAKYLLPAFNMYDFWFWFMFAVCLTIAILFAFFSKYLFRAQLVVSMFFLVYSALPAFVWYLGERGADAVSIIAALALAFLTVKYKYILVIATTAFSGSFIFFEVAGDLYGVPYTRLFGILLGIAALAFQCYICREQLEETYRDVKMKYKKTEKGGKKLYHKLDEKVHFAQELADESDAVGKIEEKQTDGAENPLNDGENCDKIDSEEMIE